MWPFYMRDYPLDHQKLHDFSNSIPYGLDSDRLKLLTSLEELKARDNFPAIQNDVGSLLQLVLKRGSVKKIFEFGSGHGHSLFWYLDLGGLEKVVLTEKRDDLKKKFQALPWPEFIKQITEYYQGDAFDRFVADDEIYDFILIDGVKSSYLDFLKLAVLKVSHGGLIAIDNSFWRGSFLDPELKGKKSAAAIAELHSYIKSLTDFDRVFVPFLDGVTLLQRKSL